MGMNRGGPNHKQFLELIQSHQGKIDSVKRNLLSELSSNVMHLYSAKLSRHDKGVGYLLKLKSASCEISSCRLLHVLSIHELR